MASDAAPALGQLCGYHLRTAPVATVTQLCLAPSVPIPRHYPLGFYDGMTYHSAPELLPMGQPH